MLLNDLRSLVAPKPVRVGWTQKRKENLEWVMNRCVVDFGCVLDPFGVRHGTDCVIWSARLVNLDFGEPVPGQA